MIYLSGKVRPDLPAMLTPRMGQQPPPGMPWAADTGRYGSPQDYTDAKYLAWLEKLPVERNLFATAPDVVLDAVTTVAMSLPLVDPIRSRGYRVALVGQDGLEHLDVPWDRFDALFLGGSTEWKLGPAARELAAIAKGLGMWVHMGRVNSLYRLRYADSIGCDSADGTILKHDPDAKVASWAPTVNAEPTLWGPR